MNLIFAAGIFDQPWIVAAVIIMGALVNWLSQRRQAKQQQEAERRANEAAPDSPQKSDETFDVEEALRRLLGEEPPTPTPAPPPIPRPVVKLPPPPPAWRGNPSGPVLTPPPLAIAMPVEKSVELSDATVQAALHLAQADEKILHPVVAILSKRRARSGDWNSLWRDRPSVRRAFVASLVFGPPKGLES